MISKYPKSENPNHHQNSQELNVTSKELSLAGFDTQRLDFWIAKWEAKHI